MLAGLSPREVVALSARPRSYTQMIRLGYSGSWLKPQTNDGVLSNNYFTLLLSRDWLPQNSSAGKLE